MKHLAADLAWMFGRWRNRVWPIFSGKHEQDAARQEWEHEASTISPPIATAPKPPL